MKKEQWLLVAAVLVAALLVLGSSGLYEPVDAGSVRPSDIATVSAAPANLLAGVPAVNPEADRRLRQITRRFSSEKRVDPPKLEAPPESPLPWIRPVPHPGLGPAHWSSLREPMAVVRKPEEKKPDDSGAALPEEKDPAEVAAEQAAADQKRKEAEDRERVEKAAKLVRRDASEKPCRITPLGDLEGQEPWKLLERWPRVRFRVDELNEKDAKSVIGSYEIGEDRIGDYLTIHLEKTLENEYHEERVRRALKDGDRAGQIEFARWVRRTLGVRYGLPAIRLAIGNLRLAWAQGVDAQLALMMGEFSRDAYDPESEIRTYLDYLTGSRANDAAILVALGDAYERGGALHAARDTFAKAANTNDVDARLRLGAVTLRLADRPSDLRAAHDEFAKAQGAGNPADKARALAGMAQARLAEGRVDDALALARQAKQTDGTTFDVHVVLGSCLYVKGLFAEAEASFATASAMEGGGRTRARTNRAFALTALDRLADAVAESEAASKSDPLNFLDPLIAWGEAQQRWNDLTKANDAFETALRRHPSNPWVLLRLAASRLRDGLPQQALRTLLGEEGVPGLLQVAPESVDGLRLAGLASAALDTPDHENAVRYLRRAFQKEPTSLELVYDLGRALHAAGRAEEALQLLEKATDPKEGFARNDARVLALHGFLQFDTGKSIDVVFDSLNRAQRAVQDTWTKSWVDAVREDISTWDRTREVVDDFERSAGQKVGNAWIEDDSKHKIDVFLDGKHAVFKSDRSGVLAAENRQGTHLRRDEGLDKFVEAEFTLQADAGFEFVCHLWQGDLPVKSAAGGGGRRPQRGGAEVGFGRDRNGRMTLWVYGANDKLLEVPVLDAAGKPRPWPDDGAAHTIRIVRTDHGKGIFEIWFDGEQVLPPAAADGKVEPIEVGAFAARRGAVCRLGVHVDADTGAPVQLLLDRVRIKRTEGLR